MSTTITTPKEGWFFEKIGRGNLNSGRDNNTKPFVSKYSVIIESCDKTDIKGLTDFVEGIIKMRGLPYGLIRIESSKTPLSPSTEFVVRGQALSFDEEASKSISEFISDIGTAIEEKYFPVKTLARTGY
jgi:hypothetical protein